MSDHTCEYKATFGPLTIQCEVGYSVELEVPPPDTLLVDSVKAIAIVVDDIPITNIHAVTARTIVWLLVAGLEPVAEALGEMIERVRGIEIRKRCEADFDKYHSQRRA